MDERTYRVTTLGCRVNRADSIAIEKELTRRGYRRAAEHSVPDIWIVNTCAVTGEGMKKSRKVARRCAASGAKVIVTGCGVDFQPSSFQVDGVDSLVPNREKHALVSSCCDVTTEDAPDVVWSPEELVRAPVKVQDGCSRFCAYCVVPFLRPEPSSRTIGEVVEDVRVLEASGAGEVILCGIDLGSYSDPSTGARLDALVEAVSSAAGKMWVRLSSIELSDVSDGLVRLMREGAVCGHLHVPLQSGDAGVLEAMGRGYTPGEFARRVREIVSAFPEISITSDVMVGFPGEDDKAFENSLALVEDLAFWRLHVFKYSRRRGTRAFEFGDPVLSAEKARRAIAMRDLARAAAERFHASQVGRIIPVLVEGVIESEPGKLFGRAKSFAGAVFDGDPALIGSVTGVRVTSSGPEGVRGVMEKVRGQ
ncbi:MAG: hypothetical protein CVT63_01770 [Candidatus Anoxymicrobium japonicum]|uniref:tRNA-2-methylthio-N(6)-dimethylallyladenosine synthase n=1 Tax=Candidatus Anoxymicrobium japonicum TaxID=2013648 RepID=A0A2N3G7B1_9ACTN|nr:MAG: hypothetical protein CVT63_01770 [Candidatus Anoxymicrobium japonicum]